MQQNRTTAQADPARPAPQRRKPREEDLDDYIFRGEIIKFCSER